MRKLVLLINYVLMFMAANTVSLSGILKKYAFLKAVFIVLAAVIMIYLSIIPSVKRNGAKGRLGILSAGYDLMCLCAVTFITCAVWDIYLHLSIGTDRMLLPFKDCIANDICAAVLITLLLTNAVIRVYSTSVQLGIKFRIVFILLWWFPLVNIIMLVAVCSIVGKEVSFECSKVLLNESRKDKRICATRYPLLLIHGVFFRDIKYLNYWGRIPAQLEQNGAKVYYGNQQSALGVKETAQELAERIRYICEKEGCEKVNIIAHSKGGLDSRYAISCLGMEKYVASLTTINTPHRGCFFADYLLKKAPKKLCTMISDRYNSALKLAGDTSPDFMGAVTNLTASFCDGFNKQVPDADGVFYQSIGSKLVNAVGGKFPLNLSYNLVKHFDGPNDGLVSKPSAEWGEKFTFIEPLGKRGISHADIIDLNRENIFGFDVREFYVSLVSDLRSRGF